MYEKLFFRVVKFLLHMYDYLYKLFAEILKNKLKYGSFLIHMYVHIHNLFAAINSQNSLFLLYYKERGLFLAKN